MRRRIAAVALAVSLMFAAQPAEAGVPYSWWCYRSGHPTVHAYTSATVGWLVGVYGYRCYGGFWRYV